MANSDTDISLLAGLSEDDSYVQILKDIQGIQKRLQASGVKIKFNIETPEKVLTNLNLKDIEKAFDNASNRMSQALIRKFGIVDKEAKTEVKSLVNELKHIRLDEINTGNISDNFEATLQRLNTVVSRNATVIKDNLSDALSESLTKEVSKMEATISAMNIKTSTEGIEKEAIAMKAVEDSAKLAAMQKEKFAEANREVARTADTTTNAINDEVNAFMDMNNLDSILNGLNYNGQQGSGIFNTLGDSFRNAFSAYSMANLLERALDRVVDVGKEAISVVKEFDDINVNLQMATGADKETVKELIDSYSELGGELGTLTKSVAESADTFLRQGRSMEETNQLIEDSIVLSKIANVESEKSAEILTATINGFQLAANEASRVNDILSSIDLHSASDASGIGDALTKVASMANNAGVSLEKTAAMIATIKDVTQDADTTIGTSLKTVLSRMNSIRAGKFIDEESGETLNDVEKVLGKINVSMRDANGQFKEAEIIIDEVGSKWKTLDSNTQKAVTTAMGGTYQANKLVALFDNYDKVLELTQVAENSTGTALSKFNDSYLPSLESKTQALVSSLQALAATTISDELYASILDTGKEIVDLTADTGILKSTLIGLGAGGALYAFQQLAGLLRGSVQDLSNFSAALNLVDNGFTTTADDMQALTNLTQGLSTSQMRLLLNTNNLTDAQKIALMVANGTEQELAEQQLQTWGLITAQQGATASTVTLTSVMRGLAATMIANPIFLVTTAVTVAVTAFNLFKSATEKAEQKLGNLKTVLQDTVSELDSINTEIENVNKQIDELLAKDTPTLTDENDLKRLRAENEELKARKILLEAQKAEEVQNVNAEVEKRYEKEFLKHFSTVTNEATGQELYYTDAKYLEIQIERASELLSLKRNLTEEEKKELDAIKSYVTEQSNVLVELADSYEPVTEEQKALKKSWEEIIAKSSEVVGAYAGTIPDITVRLVEKFATEADTQNVDSAIEKWINDLSDEDKRIMVTCDLEDASFEDLKRYLAEQKGDIESDIALEVAFDQSAFNEEIKSYEDGYSKLISAQEEWNESKSISASTFADLQENGLLEYLTFTSDGLEVNTEKLLSNAQSCKDKAVADLHAAMTSDLLAIAIGDTSKQSEAAQSVIAQLGNNAETAGNQAMTSVTQWATLGETIATVMKDAGVQGISTDKKAQMSAVYDYYKKLATDISNIDITIGNSSSGSTANDLAKAAKESLESTLTLYKAELNAGIIDLKTYLNKCNVLLDNARDKAIITTKEYWDYQKEKLETKQDIFDKVIDSAVRRYEREISTIEKQIDVLEKSNDLLEKNIDEYDRVLKVVESVYDKEIERVKEEQDAIQAKIDLLQEENDANKQALELEQAKYDLAHLQTQRTKKLYVGDRGRIYDVDHSAIREAQNNLADLTLEQTVSELEKEKDSLDAVIEELEKYKDLWASIPDAKEQSENEILASSILGANYDKVILENRITDIESFKEQYISVQEQIDDNTSMIESYEEKIEYYEGLKQNWSDLKDSYAQTQEDMYLTQVLGANAEADLLNGRLQTFENFKNQYLAIAREIQNAELYSAQANDTINIGSENISGTVGENLGDAVTTPTTTTPVVEEIPETYVVAGRVFNSQSAADAYANELERKRNNTSGGGGSNKLQYRHDGIEAGYLDSSVPKDKKLETLQKLATEEIPLKKNEVPVIAKNDELFVNTPQQMMMYENYARLQAAMQTVPMDFGEISNYKNIYNNGVTSSPHITTTVGDIHLHGVQNVDGLSDAIIKYLPNKITQELGRR